MGIGHTWGAKQASQANRLAGWMEENYNGTAKEEVKKIIQNYFASDDEFLKDAAYPLGALTEAPQKYAKRKTLQAGPRRMVSESAS